MLGKVLPEAKTTFIPASRSVLTTSRLAALIDLSAARRVSPTRRISPTRRVHAHEFACLGWGCGVGVDVELPAVNPAPSWAVESVGIAERLKGCPTAILGAEMMPCCAINIAV